MHHWFVACWSSSYASYAVCVDRSEPTALPFACVDVEFDDDVFAHLDVGFVDAVGTEEVKTYFFRVLTWSFDYVFLRHPFATCFANTTAGFEYSNYFSLSFHDYFCFLVILEKLYILYNLVILVFFCSIKKETQNIASLLVVGIPGFEPGTPCSQSRCANRTALHPVLSMHNS